MNNKYNVMITYSGEGSLRFKVRKIGEIEISAGKPVYIYNADVDMINNLRELRKILISINIGAKPTGAYRVYNLDDYVMAQTVVGAKTNRIVEKEPLSNDEISSILSSGATPEVIEEVKKETKTATKKTAAKKETKKTSKR